jgi:lysophospholipase L1-like esterase
MHSHFSPASRSRCSIEFEDPVRRIVLIALFLAAWAGAAAETKAAIVQLGIMGDSLSFGDGSDYSENPNWHTQIENAGMVAIGPTANQAVDGATTLDLAAQSQPIIALVQAQQLDYSAIVMGSNDAANMTADLVLNHIPIPAAFSFGIVQRIGAAIVALEAADPSHHVHQIVANIPDITRTPALQSLAAFLNVSPQDVDAIRQAIFSTNLQIEALARQHDIPVLDLFKFIDEVGGQPLTLAGVTTAVADLYPADGFHPSPLIHGLTANMFIDAADLGYGATLDPLSDQQIASNAGLTPLEAGPTFFNVSPYVILPEPPSAVLAAPIALALLGFAVRRRAAMGSSHASQSADKCGGDCGKH